MKLTEVIAQHFYEVNFGGNWTDVSIKDALEGISWQQASRKVGNLNTIAVLLYHTMFYNEVVSERLRGIQPSRPHESSFIVQVDNEHEWKDLQYRYFKQVIGMHQQIMSLDESRLFDKIAHSESTIYKSLHGLVEHIHYHLGQISLLKKMT